jgi:4-hydroxy-tetrahydrodipicolinate synthase
MKTPNQSVTTSRRSFLQTAGLALIACSHGTGAEQAARSVNRIPLKGVVPAALTPFNAEYGIARKEYRRHIEALSAVRGVTAIMVNGAAGQDAALTRDERRSLVAQAVAAAGNRTLIIAALRETKEVKLEDLAKDAATEGAHAMLVMPPPDKNDISWEGARVRFQKVFDATDKPVAIYHVNYSTEILTQLAGFPPVFAIKEGSGDPVAFERNLRAVRALGRDVAIWSTNSRWLLADLAVGADGILSGMGSIAADLHVALAEAVWRSDLAAARRINDQLFSLTQVFYRPGADAHTRMKYALKRLGRWECDFVRPPFKPLDDTERARIDRALKESGLVP